MFFTASIASEKATNREQKRQSVSLNFDFSSLRFVRKFIRGPDDQDTQRQAPPIFVNRLTVRQKPSPANPPLLVVDAKSCSPHLALVQMFLGCACELFHCVTSLPPIPKETNARSVST